MLDRLLQFLAAENISKSQFADLIGVSKANVTHILSGRNKPSYEFIEHLCSHFPGLNLEWLVSGRGKMYKGDNDPSPAPERRSIAHIMVFYTDGTYDDIKP